jgi:hypothetical protein
VGAAQPLKLLFLENPQQFRLQLEWNIADLVEEQCPLVSEFEAPNLAHNSAGESTFLMTE